MTTRMARHKDDLGCGLAEVEHLAVIDFDVDSRNALRIGGRADNRALRYPFQLSIAADMIRMMVRIQNARDRPSQALRFAQDRSYARRIDHGHGATGLP